MTITLKRTVNLSEPVLPEVLSAPLYEGEKNAHTFMITAEKDKLPHILSGSVVAYFERNDGNTVRVEGETKDGAAILTLSPECYQTGVFYLAVMLISDGAQTVIYAASGRVRNTQDGEIIDGGNTIPTYDEIMAHLNKYLSTDITAKVEETEDGARITMKDVVNGETTAVVKNGKPGENGATFRPTVSENGILSWTNDQDLDNPEPVDIKGPKGDSVKVSRVDESTEDGGTNVVVFSDGATLRVKNGKTGAPGENGYTPVKNKDYFDGEDGFSPTAKVTQTSDGALIEITDKNGTTSATVKHGKDGESGSGGAEIELPTDDEILQALIDTDFLLAVTDADGAIMTDENGAILVM